MAREAPVTRNRVANVGPMRMELGSQQKSEHATVQYGWGSWVHSGGLGNQPRQSYVADASTDQYSYTTEGPVFIGHICPGCAWRCTPPDPPNSPVEAGGATVRSSPSSLGKLLPLSRASQRDSIMAVILDGRVLLVEHRMSDFDSANLSSELEVHGEPTVWRITQPFEKGFVGVVENDTPVLSSQTGRVGRLTPTGWTRGDLIQLTTGILTKAAVPAHLTNNPEVSVAGRGPHHEVYEARIMELRGFAEDDEDIEAVNENSISDFWSFMEDNPYLRRAGLALLDNGDLRAVWRENDGNNVGLEFLGDESILYVMFRRYPDGRETERDAGITTFDGIVGKLQDLDLLSFVNG